MPEEIEIDSDKLRETIDEEVERAGGGRILKWISLTTAILAALAAVASLRAGATVNEALLLKTESTRLQAQASDQWAYYQAKGIKGAIAQSSLNAWAVAGKTAPPNISLEAGRYNAQQDTIKTEATRLEHERDARSRDADVLLEQHHRFAASVALFQIAIALGAIAALTRMSLVWAGSLVAGVIGLGLMASAMFGVG